jgi:hypothetical protein
MKRLAWSLVGGFAIPVLYIVALALFFVWSENLALVLRLAYPVNWPTFILVRLLPLGSFPLRPGDRILLILLVIICNTVLYSIPIYFLLWKFSTRKRKAARVDLPPDPPRFVQH